jgi:ubiquinone/menaquinone biosynthesis C-methylase UbiE
VNTPTTSPHSSGDPFASVAPFYDLDLEGYEDDIALYRQFAETAGGPVLDLGCGTGRVAWALAEDGVEVIGVDFSEAMLAVARARTGSRTPTWVTADLRTFDLEREFALVLVPLGGLQHMEELDDLVAAFGSIRRHLAPEGLAVVDVEAPLPDDFAPGPQPLIEHWTREWRSTADAMPVTVSKLVSVEAQPAQARRSVTWHFDVQGSESPLRRVTAQFDLRIITLGELELAGRLVGLERSAAWGDYDMTPFDDGAQRLLMAFARSEAAG